MKNDTWIIGLVILNVILTFVCFCMSSKRESFQEFEISSDFDFTPVSTPRGQKNMANCQGNAYSAGCVWNAAYGGTLYDVPTFCS